MNKERFLVFGTDLVKLNDYLKKGCDIDSALIQNTRVSYSHGGEAFAAKYECTCSFMLFATTIFKTIAVKGMGPNFVHHIFVAHCVLSRSR